MPGTFGAMDLNEDYNIQEDLSEWARNQEQYFCGLDPGNRLSAESPLFVEDTEAPQVDSNDTAMSDLRPKNETVCYGMVSMALIAISK